jgi:hypothetical protein
LYRALTAAARAIADDDLLTPLIPRLRLASAIRCDIDRFPREDILSTVMLITVFFGLTATFWQSCFHRLGYTLFVPEKTKAIATQFFRENISPPE